MGESAGTEAQAKPAGKRAPTRKAKKKEEKVEKEEDLKYIFYFYRPQLVETLWQWEMLEG